MKKIIISALSLLSAMTIMAGNGFQVRYNDNSRANTHKLEFTLGEYGVSGVVLQGNTYTAIDFEGKVATRKAGFAELPFVNATVMIDPLKNVALRVIPGEYTDIRLDHPLVPSRGVIYRSQDPATVPYAIDPRSLTDTWYPVSLAESTDPFILRDIRGVSVYVYPFRYNAVQQVLRVYHSITIELEEVATTPVNPLVKEHFAIAREMDGVYRSVFINYATASRDNLTIGESGDIHVITTARDEAAIQPYVQWKREKGFNVSMEVVPVNTVVNPFVQAAYDNNNNILYVLLVGDWADVKSETSPSGRPEDPQVGCVVGTDDFADIAVGRFSANSPADVTVQVNKVINYERTPDMAGTWYASAMGIASAEGAGIGDDGESDIQHEDVIYNDKLDPFTYGSFTPVYDPGASAAQVTASVNTGVSVINYTGHGWGDGWGTTGFSSSNVAGLTNGDKLPFIVSVACNNGDFDLGTCFAESWLRKENGGGIMFLGASISQPWAEPMRGQDYFMDILIGGYDYTAHTGQNGISTTEQRTTLGAIVFNGLTLMCTESGYASDWETAKTWNLFGDPSLQARTAMPLALNVSTNLVIVGVPFTTNITTSEGPVENAMVTLSQGELYFTGITDAAGNVTIGHALNPGNAKLVVTAFNTGTVYTDVSVIPPDGAYVTIASVEVSDGAGNGNGQLDYGETADLTIALVNVGTADAAGVSAVLTTTDDFVSVTGGMADYGTIPAGDTVFVTNGFQVAAAENIPDLHFALFDLSITDNIPETWVSSFGLNGHAPLLAMESYVIDDAAGNGNGRLDAGETALIAITVKNEGSADAYLVNGSLSTLSSFISINNSPLAYGDLAAGASAVQSFEISTDAATPSGHMAAFTIELSADMNITATGGFTEYVGQIPMLLVDWDGNHNSPDAIALCLTNLEVGYDRVETLPADLNLYSSIFVCLGTYSENHVMTAEEGQMLAAYLNAGGQLYLEGADTWYYDQQFTPTPVHTMFHITGIADGSGDLGNVAGQVGSIAEDMTFTFTGDNSYIDHIDYIAPAQMIFMNTAPEYGAAVSYDGGTYKTVGMSFEFGGLQDGERTKDDLMIQILEFFGIEGVWTDVREPEPGLNLQAGAFPNPFSGETVIRFETTETSGVVLDIYTIHGQRISRLAEASYAAGIHEVRWQGVSDDGNPLPAGFYVYRIQSGNRVVSGKIMLAR